MRTTIQFLAFLLFSTNLWAQFDITTNADFKNIYDLKTNYQKDIQELKKLSQDKIDKEEASTKPNQERITELKKKRDAVFFNSKFLNQFFSSEITSFATTIKDQSVEKYFISLNTDAKTLSIGRSIDFRELCFKKKDESKLKKMANILTFYTQSGLDKGFSNLREKNKENDEFEWSNNLGFGLRFTHFFNGIISFSKPDAVTKVNEKIIDDYIKANIAITTVDANGKVKLVAPVATILSDLELIEKISDDDADKKKRGDKYAKKKYYDTYKAIIDKQIETIKTEKLYSSYIAAWIGGEFYKPITDKIVLTTTDNITTVENKFRDWRFEAFGNGMKNWSSGNSIKMKLAYSKFKTDEFTLKNATPINIQNITQINQNTILVNSTTSAFVGNFIEKTVSTFRAEAALLFVNNSFGVSGAFEKYLNYDIKNWKVGVPFSLKDKDDKPTVNFELVWREVNKTHVVGITAAYSFGKFIK